MKKEYYLYVSNAEEYVAGDESWCFSFSDRCDLAKTLDWVLLKTFSLDFSPNLVDLRANALESLASTEQRLLADHEAKLADIRDRRQKLLALAHTPEATNA